MPVVRVFAAPLSCTTTELCVAFGTRRPADGAEGRAPRHADHHVRVDVGRDRACRRQRDPLEPVDLAGLVGHGHDVRDDPEPVVQGLGRPGRLVERRLDLDLDEARLASGLQEARDRRAGGVQLRGDRLHRQVLHVVQVGRTERVVASSRTSSRSAIGTSVHICADTLHPRQEGSIMDITGPSSRSRDPTAHANATSAEEAPRDRVEEDRDDCAPTCRASPTAPTPRC